MKANERGNAILISAILVFGLTVTALGVSRLLVKGTQGMATQREFLGVQAHQIGEAAIWRWMRDAEINRATIPLEKSYSDFIAGRVGGGADRSPITAKVTWVVSGENAYTVTAAASLADNAGSTEVSRTVTAIAECPITGSCTKWAISDWAP